MTRRLRPLILLLMAPLPAALPAPVWAQDGQDSITERDQRPGFVAWNKGLAAERAGKLEDALAAYQTAERDEPQVPEFRERAHIVRFALAQSFTGRAERALLEGNVTDAAALL